MLIMEATTTVGCVNRCDCCPQDVLDRAYGEDRRKFRLVDFEKCLSTIPKQCEIGFCGFSEPFLNPICSQMIAATTSMGFQQRLLTTLVGFRKYDIPFLKRSKIHYIRFHIPDTEHFRFPTTKWIALHSLFYSMELAADYDYMTMGEIDPLLLDYLYSQSVSLHYIMHPDLISRAGNLRDQTPLGGNLYCSQDRWHYNVLLPNGDVYLCCMDFGLKHRLGNLLTQPYEEIYHRAEELRLADHSQMICAQCELAVSGHWTNPFGRPTAI